VGVAVLVQIQLADPQMCFRGMVSESSQLSVELARTDFWSVLIAYAPGIKCLVQNCQCKFAGLVRGPPHKEIVLTHERFGLETNILDVYVFSHKSLFVLAGETF
jgi:hypothetical protein